MSAVTWAFTRSSSVMALSGLCRPGSHRWRIGRDANLRADLLVDLAKVLLTAQQSAKAEPVIAEAIQLYERKGEPCLGRSSPCTRRLSATRPVRWSGIQGFRSGSSVRTA
jgi:hypothetical protein